MVYQSQHDPQKWCIRDQDDEKRAIIYTLDGRADPWEYSEPTRRQLRLLSLAFRARFAGIPLSFQSITSIERDQMNEINHAFMGKVDALQQCIDERVRGGNCAFEERKPPSDSLVKIEDIKEMHVYVRTLLAIYTEVRNDPPMNVKKKRRRRSY